MIRTCIVDDCEKPHEAKGYCHRHYEWQRLNPGKTTPKLQSRSREMHGMTNTSEYRIWMSMLCRCNNPKSICYAYYGGRGITVCDEWLNSFLAFYSHVGPRPRGFTIDRVDNNKGYEPGNVVWATRQAQVRNRRRSRKNTSGVTGVNWSKRDNRWNAELFVSGRKVLRKGFANIDDAIAARKDAERIFIS